MIFKFVHAADIHLDSPLLGLERYDGAPVERLRGATRRALENLVALCIDEEVGFLLIAGDVYDGDWKDYNTGLFFVSQMVRLSKKGIRVFLVRGNHDAASRITKKLRLPERVVELITRKPQTVMLDDLGVAIHGRSYPKRDVSEDLSAGYPDATPDLFNIGLLHTAIDGRPGHEPYAPCRVDALVAKGYDYWALGHVHQREVLAEDPWIVFPGNLQGRHIRETGDKGCTLVTVEDGAIVSVEHRRVDVVRWVLREVDVSGAETPDSVVDLVRVVVADELEVADGRALAVRLRLCGETDAHASLMRDPERWKGEIRAAAIEEGPDEIWIEQIRFDTRTPIDLEALRERDDPLGGLLRSFTEVREDAEALRGLARVFDDLAMKLPPELRMGTERLDLGDAAVLRALVDEVEQLLVPRLLGEEES